MEKQKREAVEGEWGRRRRERRSGWRKSCPGRKGMFNYLCDKIDYY